MKSWRVQMSMYGTVAYRQEVEVEAKTKDIKEKKVEVKTKYMKETEVEVKIKNIISSCKI